MKVATLTGVINPEDVSITKGVGGIYLKTTYDLMGLLTTDDPLLTVWIERGNGNNQYSCTNIPLKIFAHMSVFGGASMWKTVEGGVTYFHAVCEITQGGAVALEPNDTIKLRLANLDPDDTFIICGMEDPDDIQEILAYDQKTVLTDDVSRNLRVANYGLMAITGALGMSEIRMTLENGRIVSMTPDELRATQVDNDPVLLVQNGVAGHVFHPSIIVVPIVGVAEIEVIKSNLDPVYIYLQTEKSTSPQ